MKKKDYTNLKIIFIVILGVILLINVIFLTGLNKTIKEKITEQKEVARPANIEIVAIKDLQCTDCYDPIDIINFVISKNYNVTKQEILDEDSDRAKEIINKYDIKNIPIVLILGEIDKVKDLEGFDKVNDALIQSNIIPPFKDLTTNEVKGLVSLIYLNVSCDKCSSLTNLIDQLKTLKVKLIKEEYINSESETGLNLIAKYSITKVPAIILSRDIEVYDIVKSAWENLGTVEDDGSYITRSNNPPYLDITEKKVKGLVTLTLLDDKSCTECYNVSLHKLVLDRFNMYIEDERMVDITDSEGKYLINKYSITQVPTIILSGEVSEYTALTNIWDQVGTVEEDGSYVFRKLEVMGTYKDLTADKVVVIQG